MVHAPSCPPWQPILPHRWEQRAGGVEVPGADLAVVELCRGGLAVTGGGTASWGAA